MQTNNVLVAFCLADYYLQSFAIIAIIINGSTLSAVIYALADNLCVKSQMHSADSYYLVTLIDINVYLRFAKHHVYRLYTVPGSTDWKGSRLDKN